MDHHFSRGRSCRNETLPRRAACRLVAVLVVTSLCALALPGATLAQPDPGSARAPNEDAAPPLPNEEIQSDQAADLQEPDSQLDAATAAGAPSTAAPSGPVSDSSPTASLPRDPKTYGLWVLLPAAVAILLAIFIRQVVPALVVGVLLAAYMMAPCLAADDALSDSHPLVRGFRLAVERYVIGSIDQAPDKNFAQIKVIIFTLTIGFTVGVIGRNGGTAGMVKLVAGQTRSPRRGAFTAWLAGLVVFFDDYANTMIVGPTMRSVFDRLKISRAKLAYIVDSTAAPVASIALIGTWVGAEIIYIQQGIDAIADSATPAFLINEAGQRIGGMDAFLSSLPYRFYPILALFLVFLVAVTGRDFGPMRKSQRLASRGSGLEPAPVEGGPATADKMETAAETDATGGNNSSASAISGVVPRAWLGVWPILTLVGVTIGVLVYVGLQAPNTVALMTAAPGSTTSQWDLLPFWQRAATVISNSDSFIAILYGAVLSAICAVVLNMISHVCSVKDAIEAGIRGMTTMFPAIVILVLAWAISTVLQDLKLGEIVSARLQSAEFPAHWLPVVVFATAAGISFATGTSWGTMGILCPVTVEIAARLGTGMELDTAQPLFYASVGSVLAGAIFGDHCSPISDTTVLSSIACGCPHEEHVWTQLPYALVTAVVAMGAGDVLCNVYNQPWYVGIGAGAVALILVVFIFGRDVQPQEIRHTAPAEMLPQD